MFLGRSFSQNKSTYIFVILTITNFILLYLLITQYFFPAQKPSIPELSFFDNKHLTTSQVKSFFVSVAHKKGGKYAYDLLKVAKVPPGNDIHLLGHYIGNELYKQRGADGLSLCTSDFRYACAHSIVIGLITDKGEKAIPEIMNACRNSPGKAGAYPMCFHGLGHGVLAYMGYELPKVIPFCKKFGTAQYNYREYMECVSGAVMETISGGDHDKELWNNVHIKYFRANDPLYPCNADFMPDIPRPICYMYLTPHLFDSAKVDQNHLTDETIKKTMKLCDAIPLSDIASREACYGGFGIEFILAVREYDIRDVTNMTIPQLKQLAHWCEVADSQQAIVSCIKFAATTIFWGGENDIKGSINLCSITRNKDAKDTCYRRMLTDVAYYMKDNKNYRVSFCKSIPKNYWDECQRHVVNSPYLPSFKNL